MCRSSLVNFWSGLRAQFKPCDSCKLLRRGSLLFLFHCQSNASDKTREAVLNICWMFEEDVTEVFYAHRPRYNLSNTSPWRKRDQGLEQQLVWSDYSSRITGLRYIYYLFVVFKARYFENNTHADYDKAKLSILCHNLIGSVNVLL